MGISRAEALDSMRSDDLVGIGMEADAVRRRLHPEGVVSYAVTCRVDCSNGDLKQVGVQAERSLAVGGSGIVLAGVEKLGLEEVVGFVRELRAAAPDAWICGLNSGDLTRLAGSEGALGSVLRRLVDAGWNSPASDAPELIAPAEALEQWFGLQRAAHRAGVRTVAGMRFGAGESLEQKVDFLERVAALQDETGGFASFAPESAASGLQGPTAVECLKNVAVTRLMLDTIPSIEAGRATHSLKVLETMLRFGADDAGEVLVQNSAKPDLREEDLRRVIRDAGFSPVERDPGYRLMYVA